MSLLAKVVAHLRERGTPFALVGAAAMAVHGVARSTRDLDLLVVDPECLTTSYWESLRKLGVEVAIHRGDAADPLAGVVRLTASGASPVDLVVGRTAWQAEVTMRAVETRLEDVTLPAASLADLILLKLYAGGPQDAWDIAQLLVGPEGPAAREVVDRRVTALPEDSRRLWARVRGAPGAGGPASDT